MEPFTVKSRRRYGQKYASQHARQDSNLQPSVLGTDALPIELRARCHHGRKVRGEQEKEKENECPTIPLGSGACGTIGNEQPIINYFRAVFPWIAPREAILLIPRELLTSLLYTSAEEGLISRVSYSPL